MGVVLLGSGGALGYLARNLEIELGNDFRTFLLDWRDAIEPISLTSKTSRILATLKGFSMASRPAIPKRSYFWQGRFI